MARLKGLCGSCLEYSMVSALLLISSGSEFARSEGSVPHSLLEEKVHQELHSSPEIARELFGFDVIPFENVPTTANATSTHQPVANNTTAPSTLFQENQGPSLPPTLAPTKRPTRGPVTPEFQVTRSPTSPPKPQDFAKFNEIFKNAVISFPDLDIQQNVLFQPLVISLKQFSCSKVSFGDIKINSEQKSNQTVHADLEILNLTIECDFNFRWSYIFLSGQGHAQVRTGGNSVFAGLDMFSPDFSQHPPESAKVTTCKTDIKILGLDFSGNIASEIFNMFSQLIIDTVDGLINDKICVELNGIGADTLAKGFKFVLDLVEPYLEPVAPWRYNASYPEFVLMDVPMNTTLISWNDKNGYGVFLGAALDEGETLLSSLRQDPSAPSHIKHTFPNGTAYPDGYDLGINVILRDYLLKDDRAFVLNLTNMGLNGSNVLYDNQDQLTATKLSLQYVRVYGLDTFTKMEPFTRIGNFTLQNDFSWDYLQIEAVMKMEVKASSLPDSIIRDPQRIDPYVEEFNIAIGVEHIDIVVALLFALEPDQMKALEVGPLLDLITMIPCIMSSLYDFDLTRLNVTIGDIELPSVEGLVSPGLDRVLTNVLELGFLAYKGTLLKAIPAIFETTIRDKLTGLVDDATCPLFDPARHDSYVDLRDLLLNPKESVALGGTGDAEYGDLASSIYGILRGMWLEVKNDGTLGLNKILIDPITEATSGSAGLFRYGGALYNFTTNENNQQEFKTLVNRFEFGIYDLRVANLDTVVHPMSVIQPINHPFITQSTLNIGPIADRPLESKVTVLMALDIDNSPLAMNNVIDMGFSVSSAELFLEMLTMMSSNDLLDFRLGDGLNVNCWFAMFPAPQLNFRGYRMEGGADRGIELRRVFAQLSDLRLNIECLQCSPGLASLPEMADIFNRTRVTDILSYRLPLTVEEFAISQPLQVYFDRWLTDAPYKCPHRVEYVEDYVRPWHWEIPEFDQLSVEASDTIFFTSAVLAQVGFALVVETHYPWNLTTLSPLSGQENFIPPNSSDMINWMDLDGDGSKKGGVDGFAENVRSYFGEPQKDSKTGDFDLGVNFLVRDFLADKEDTVDFVALLGGNPLEFTVQGLAFQIHSIKVRGLDSFTRFDIMKPIAPQTILNSMRMEFLEVEMEWSTGSQTDPPQIVKANFRFEDINATVPTFLALDLNIIRDIQLGDLMWLGKLFPCALTASYGLHFPQIMMTIGNFSVPTVEGFLSDSSDALRLSLEETYAKYANRTLKALPVMMDTSLRSFFNTYISEYIHAKANCTHITDVPLTNDTSAAKNRSGLDKGYEVETYHHSYDGLVDFRELLLSPDNSSALGGMGFSTYGDVVRSLITPVEEELLWVNPETKLSGINGLIGPVTKFLSGEDGTIFVEGDLFSPVDLSASIGSLDAKISFGLADLRIENIDTMGDPLSLADPVLDKPEQLNNSAGIGIGHPFRVSIRLLVKLKTVDKASGNGEKDVSNNILMSLDMHDALALVDTLLKISEGKLVHFPLRSFLEPYCWLSLFPPPKLDSRGIRLPGVKPTVSIRDLALTVKKLNLTIGCIECSSPGMQGLSDALAKPESADAVTKIANEVLGYGSNIVTGNLVQDALDRFLNEGPRRCPHSSEYVPNAENIKYKPLNFDRSVGTSSLLILLVCVAFSLLGIISSIVLFVKWIVWRRNRRWVRTLPARQIYILEQQQESARRMERELNKNTTAMLISKDIPLVVRFIMPLTIWGNIALFLSGHLSIAAETRLEAQIAGEDFTLDQFFQFSIMNSTIDMWEAGAREMAIFLLIFAGIWPYVKQFTSFFCWVAPPRTLSVSKRGSIYLWLDILAKWSMVDIFVLLISMISFRVHAVTPNVVFLPKHFFSLDVYIVPKWGLFANLIAQMISQISSHFIIHYHRVVVRRASKEYEEQCQSPTEHHALTAHTASDSDEKSNEEEDAKKQRRLCDNAFTRPHKGRLSKLVTRSIASHALVAGAFVLIIFLAMGCTMDTVGVEIQGLVSFISGLGAPGNTGVYKEFAVFSIAKLLMDDAKRLGSSKYIASYLFLSVVILLTVFFVPILQSLSLVYHWFKPMNDKERKRFSIVIEVLSAWQYAEVFILALFVASWQLAPTSETIMAQQCNEFQSLFEMFTYYGVLNRKDAHCFRVQANILSGAYLMASGALLLALANSFVMKASNQYFWDKETARKAFAMEKQVPEEAGAKVAEKRLRKIRPPPVLFTDTFRWVLRRQNLGDTRGSPIQSSIIMSADSALGHDRLHAADGQEDISSASSEC